MKNSGFVSDMFVSVVLIFILLGFFKSSTLFMPMQIEAMMLVGLLLAFVAFVGLVWKDNARDERERIHQLSAGRVSFLVATATLVTGIVSQGLKHEIDVWLVLTLVTMILSKMVSRIYSQIKN